jgi:N-acetyl sugar amidotransferase
MLKYCSNCCLPNTKPGVILDEKGWCNGCRSSVKKDLIDWDSREKELQKIVDEIKAKNNPFYDCVVPVSGGKDSWYQAYIIAKRYGLKVLCVSVAPHLPTTEGIHNLNTMIKDLNVDHIKITLKNSVIKKLRQKCFFEMGEPNWAEHCCVLAGVVQAALLYDVSLIVWGEDVSFEFGGIQSQESKPSALDINKADLIKNKSVLDFLGDDISKRDVFFYMYPEYEKLLSSGIQSIYLGHFDKWDGRMHYNFAKERGFHSRAQGPLSGNYIDYDNIDEKLCEINIWFKYLKFGFWRPTDQTCYDIWNKRLSREDAVKIIQKVQDEFPSEYFEDFLRFHGITEKEFFDTVDRYRNQKIWHKINGKWELKEKIS